MTTRGKEARTRYRVLERYGHAALVEEVLYLRNGQRTEMKEARCENRARSTVIERIGKVLQVLSQPRLVE